MLNNPRPLFVRRVALILIMISGTLLGASAAELDVLKLESAPDGHYEVTLVIESQNVKAEFVVADGTATCVKSERAPGARVLQGARGRFQLLANGVFIIGVRGEGYTATQFWAFQPDGSALIKEVPDRGEKQRAVPVVEG